MSLLQGRRAAERCSAVACAALRVVADVVHLPTERIPALDDPEQHNHNRDHQEDVDEASERVGRDDPEQPQHEEDDEEC